MAGAWTLEIDGDHVAWLTFDLPGSKVNKFTADALGELNDMIDKIHGDPTVQVLVIRSGKPDNFIVGADIDELARIRDLDDAKDKARTGLAVFRKIESLTVPTIAMIHGPCLGGGLEMALACRYRIVTEHPKTSVGLPEVNLGILPGWGGTQRLPKLLGLPAALKMILGGKPVDGRRAAKMRLADAIAAAPFVEAATRRLAVDVLTRQGQRDIRRRRRRARAGRWLELTALGRALVYRGARKQVTERTKGHYPAPLEALEVVRRSYRRRGDGFALETAAFGRLAVTPISRNLVWLFQASQRLKKAGHADGAPVTRAGIVGAGIMGSGIAWSLSRAGIAVRMRDVSWEALARGTAAASKACAALVKRRSMTEAEATMLMHRIAPTVDATGFDCVQVAIEAVAEDLDLKRRVLQELEAVLPEDAVICTNTSSLPLEELASALQRPQRFLGLHFFNPVPRMPLVEVVPAKATEDRAVIVATELVRRMGKMPMVVGGCAGFLVNRILLPYLVESAWMFEEGVEIDRIDTLLERFGMPMGPLALVDEVGLDVGFKVAKVLEAAYGQRMHVPESLGRIAESPDTLGRKTGRGFYRYDNGSRKPNRRVGKIARGTGKTLSDEQIVDRAVLIMINEAARCLEEGVIDGPETLDMAMVMGTGFAPFRGGPLHYADERGLGAIHERLEQLAGEFGDRFSPAPLIARLAAEQGRFYKADAA